MGLFSNTEEGKEKRAGLGAKTNAKNTERKEKNAEKKAVERKEKYAEKNAERKEKYVEKKAENKVKNAERNTERKAKNAERDAKFQDFRDKSKGTGDYSDVTRVCNKCGNTRFLPRAWAQTKAPRPAPSMIVGIGRHRRSELAMIHMKEAQERELFHKNAMCPSCGSSQYTQYKPGEEVPENGGNTDD